MKAGWWDASLTLRVLAVNNLRQFPSFWNSHLMPPACNLVPPPPPPPHASFLDANFVAIRENIFGSSEESNKGFCGGTSASQPPSQISSSFNDFLMPAPQYRTDLGHTLLSSHCTRGFSLAHDAPIFSRIHPLGGQGRHVWQIVRSRVQSPAFRVQHLEFSVQSPESTPCLFKLNKK